MNELVSRIEKQFNLKFVCRITFKNNRIIVSDIENTIDDYDFIYQIDNLKPGNYLAFAEEINSKVSGMNYTLSFMIFNEEVLENDYTKFFNTINIQKSEICGNSIGFFDYNYFKSMDEDEKEIGVTISPDNYVVLTSKIYLNYDVSIKEYDQYTIGVILSAILDDYKGE